MKGFSWKDKYDGLSSIIRTDLSGPW
jgi:hypothetical protein